MPKLTDVISTLVSQCAAARVAADLEAVKTAQLYSAHEMLKHFSVPRMRIRDIDINLKAAVTGSNAVTQHLQAIPVNDTVAFIHETLARQFNLSIKNRQEYRAAISPLLKELNTQIQEMAALLEAGDAEFSVLARKLQTLFQQVAKQIVAITYQFLEGNTNIDGLHKALVDFFNEKAVVQKIDGNNLEIEVNTAILKELPLESLLSVKLTVFEEGYEIKLDDGQTLLVPE